MNDNFGPGQPRVLNVADRNLDQVVFQQARPPLTSEWNLINQICDLKSQQAVQTSLPSGWVKVGAVEDTGAVTTSDSVQEAAAETAARSGQVLTSLTYGSDLFKLICRDTSNVAIVNGWPIVVQTNLFGSTNILMTLPPEADTSTYRYDIVFLEVWKKLISSGDPLYPYGNVQSLAFADNEIVWDVIGAETTKRVQTQYRIRTFPSALYNISVDPTLYPEGLGWSNVKAIGGNAEENYTTASFVNAGEKDIGLYRAGDGSPESQELLNTIDGYVYAIPMFMVYRRGSSSLFTPNNIHSNLFSRTDANLGTPSDRPDGKYSDVVYPGDIVDLRHQIITSGKDLDSFLQSSFRKLVTNELSTSLGQGFTNSNGKIVCSGGSSLFKVEQINGHSSFIPDIGDGCATSDFKRRAYCNAGITTDHNVFEVPMLPDINLPSHWGYGSIIISSFFSTPLGEIVSVDGLYFIDDSVGDSGPVPGATFNTTQISLQPASMPPVARTSSCRVYMEFTFRYFPQRAGFFDVPKKFYEVSKNLYQPIATRDQTIPVRFNSSQNPLIVSTKDYVKYQGGNYTENYAFGHEYLLYLGGWSSSSFTVSCPNGKYNNYTILGVKTVQLWNGSSYGNPESILQIIRNVVGTTISYQVTLSASIVTATDILVTLYTGSGDPEVGDDFKFFEMSKQGRGVTDVYEMLLLEASQNEDGNFVLDTGDKPIIAIGTITSFDGTYTVGQAFAYDSDLAGSGEALSVSIVPEATPSAAAVNSFLPVLSSTQYFPGVLPTRVCLSASASSDIITVPVLVHSYVTTDESAYNFYYKFNAYQGLLSSIKKGKIEKEGSAIVTSEGSGTVNNFTLAPSDSAASVTQASRVVTQTGTTPWSSYVKSGDYFNLDSSPYYYRILTVDSDTQLTLAELFVESSTVTPQAYSIVRLDVPNSNISNVIDRMPSSDASDYNGKCSEFSMTFGGVPGTLHEVQEKVALQDPLDTIVNDFQLGISSSAVNRGRIYFRLTEGKNDFFKLGVLTPYIKYGDIAWTSIQGYKKVYQAYLYNEAYYDSITSSYRDLTGRLYLLVVSSETNNDTTKIMLSSFSDQDAVDIFELSGRPIIKTI